jgi:SAM-dependent methyltransferase
MRSRPSSYYDNVYRKIIAERGLSSDWIDERHTAVLPYVIGSVFDIGCGLGEIANRVKGEYLGVDTSPVAVEYAAINCVNPLAKFVCLDYRLMAGTSKRFDTVLMLELLEHVDSPRPAVGLAFEVAKKRIIATVPRDMPGWAHVRPTWNKRDLEALLGKPLLACRLFGGPMHDRWWIAVREVE